MSSVALPHTLNLTTNLFSHITYTLCYRCVKFTDYGMEIIYRRKTKT